MPTTPLILVGIIYNPRHHRVEVYILQQTDKVGSRIYWLAPKPVMKQRTKAIVALVVVAHIRHADAFHCARQLFFSSRQQQVNVVGHQAISVNMAIRWKWNTIPVLRGGDFSKNFFKLAAILLVIEYSITVDAAEHHVIHTCGTNFATLTGHSL